MAHFEHFGYPNLETLDGAQKALKQLVFGPGKVEGRDGPNAPDAVRKFQAHATIKSDTIKIDGIVGDEARGALVAALAQSTPSGVNRA